MNVKPGLKKLVVLLNSQNVNFGDTSTLPIIWEVFLCYYNDDETNYKVPNLKILSS